MRTSHPAASLAWAWLVPACLVAAAPARAHELGQTKALVQFERGEAFAIEILVDPQALLARLELETGRAPTAFQHPREVVGKIERLAPEIARGIHVLFDGRAVPASFAYRTDVPPLLAAGLTSTSSVDVGIIRLTGVVPTAAHEFAFSYDWTYGATALMVYDDRAPEPRTIWIGRGEPSRPLPMASISPAGATDVFDEYLILGFQHILPKGVDHILFVLGLFLLSAGWRSLLLQISTFTIAHTATLGLTMAGAISLSPVVVEPLIALSIAYVALENLMTTRLRASRLALVFAFGLLHGMGFAGVLGDLGLPASQFVTALVGFNLGVEAGQVSVLAIATLAVAGWRGREASLLPLVARPASVLIAMTGVYWTLERVVGS
jgi:hypothetical protein